MLLLLLLACSSLKQYCPPPPWPSPKNAPKLKDVSIRVKS